MSEKKLPLFNPDLDSKYDVNTYIGRCRHFFEIFNPRLLFISSKKLNDSIKLLNEYNNGNITINDIKLNPILNKQLWEAKTIKSAIIHPDTNESIPLPFRMSCFVPMNMPIACGMLLTKTQISGLFWQIYNQSYNVAVNYCNGNKTNPLSFNEIFTSYIFAVTAACSTLYISNYYVNSIKNIYRQNIMKKIVPFIAVSTAGSLNCILMRYNEIKNGINIMDNNDNIIGQSKIVGKIAVLQTALSRFVVPAPILLFPPITMNLLERINYIKVNKPINLSLQLFVISLCLYGALPMAVGLFPQKSSINAKYLESEFQNSDIDTFYYNKGL